jgi:hypothetical protein
MTAGLGDTIGAAKLYSPADEPLNRRRRTAGLVLDPVALLVIAGVVMLLGGAVV